MNNICIIGNLCSHPELKSTQSGVMVCAVSVAVPRDYKVNGEKVADFMPCVFWRQKADFVSRYFNKGDIIAVEGSLESRKYTDKEGNNRITWEIIANKVGFCGKRERQESAEPNVQSPSEAPFGDDDELPF